MGKKKRIGTFKQFLNEQNKLERGIKPEAGAPAVIGYENYGGCTEYCLHRIEEEVGSLDPDAIFGVAAIHAEARVKSRLVLLYVIPMVEEYLKVNAEILIPGLDEMPPEERDEKGKQAIDAICYAYNNFSSLTSASRKNTNFAHQTNW